jgi:hypothetical protein
MTIVYTCVLPVAAPHYCGLLASLWLWLRDPCRDVFDVLRCNRATTFLTDPGGSAVVTACTVLQLVRFKGMVFCCGAECCRPQGTGCCYCCQYSCERYSPVVAPAPGDGVVAAAARTLKRAHCTAPLHCLVAVRADKFAGARGWAGCLKG